MEGGPRALAFSSDGALLGVGNQDGAVSVVDLASETPRWRRLARHEGAANAIAFLQRGERSLLASVGDDGRVLVAAVDSGTEAQRGDPLIVRPLAIGPLSALAVLDRGPETPRLVAGSVRGGLALLGVSDQVSLEQTFEFGPPRDAQIAGLVAVAKDRVALAGWDGTVRTIELPSGKELRASKVSSLELTAIAISSDRQVLAVGGWAKGVSLLDASSLRPIGAAAEPHPGPANALALAGSGSTLRGLALVTSSVGDETLAVSTPFGEKLATARRTKIRNVPSAVALSPDGKRIACASFDGSIGIYKMPSSAAASSSEPKGETP
jgi:WD40 repeat protein